MKTYTDLSSLRTDADLQQRYAVEVKNRFEQLAKSNNGNTAEEDWSDIAEFLQNSAKKLLST